MDINLLTFALSSSLWRSTENRTWWQVPLRQLHLLCSINLTFCDRKNIWLPWGSNPGQIWWWVPLGQLHLLCSIPQSWCERKKLLPTLGIEPRTGLTTSAFEPKALTSQPPLFQSCFRGTDYIIVSDAVNHIFPLPDSISLPLATKLGDKGVPALALVQALERRCLDLLEQVENVKINEWALLLTS